MTLKRDMYQYHTPAGTLLDIKLYINVHIIKIIVKLKCQLIFMYLKHISF